MMKWIKKNPYLTAGIGVLLLLIIGIVICSVWKIPMENLLVERPSYGDANKQLQFYVQDQDGEESSVILEIHPRHYMEEEARERFEACYEAMLTHILGKNTDTKQVCEKLNLSKVEGFEDLNVMIYPGESFCITSEGDINWDQIEENRYDTCLYLTISYESWIENYKIPITLVKTEQVMQMDVQRYLGKLEQVSYQQSELELPDSFNGKKISYYTKVDSNGIMGIGMVVLCFIFFLWYREKAIKREEEKVRREQLEYDYPELISKFLIYMKAGMSVRKTWQKIVEDYKKQKKKSGQRYIYEEMAITLQDMELGLGERKAYLKFGKRCGQQSLIRFGSLLEQNLRKGTTGITNLLEAERIQALEHRKQEIKAAGEVAGMKLLMPMMLLFGLVMIMIMVPSFMAFGI